MRLLPSSSRKITARPVAQPFTGAICVVPTPSSFKVWRRVCPVSSSPTWPQKSTAPPKRAAATAAFAPLPPME